MNIVLFGGPGDGCEVTIPTDEPPAYYDVLESEVEYTWHRYVQQLGAPGILRYRYVGLLTHARCQKRYWKN